MADLAGSRRVQAAAALAWHRLGTPAALSATAAWWFTPVGFLGPLLADTQRLGGSAIFWIGVATAGQFVVVASFWLGRRARVFVTSSRIAPAFTLAVVISAVLLRGYVLAWLTYAAGLSPGLELGYRTLGSLPLIGGALVSSALLACARHEHRELVAVLNDRRSELLLANAEAEGRLAEVQVQLLQQVRSSLEPRIRDLQAALDSVSDGSGSPPVAEIRHLVDVDVRGLIAELVEGDEFVSTNPVLPPRTSTPSRLPARLTLSDAVHPGVQGVLVGAAAIASASRDLPIGAALLYCVVLGLLTALILRACRFASGRARVPLAFALLAAAICGAVATYGAVVIVRGIGMPSPSFLGAPAFSYGAVVGAVLAAYGALDRQRVDLERDLAETVAQLDTFSQVLQRRSWIARRRLSLLLHGTVQSALHAAALRLGTAADPSVIARVKDDVTSALASLDAPTMPSPTFDASLASIADTWAGVCAITWSVPADAMGTIERDGDMRECVIEIAREGVHNAIVHGRASEVSIAVAETDRRINVVVSDNGRPSQGTPGSGSRMLDEMCAGWSRTATSTGSQLAAELPMV